MATDMPSSRLRMPLCPVLPRRYSPAGSVGVAQRPRIPSSSASSPFPLAVLSRCATDFRNLSKTDPVPARRTLSWCRSATHFASGVVAAPGGAPVPPSPSPALSVTAIRAPRPRGSPKLPSHHRLSRRHPLPEEDWMFLMREVLSQARPRNTHWFRGPPLVGVAVPSLLPYLRLSLRFLRSVDRRTPVPCGDEACTLPHLTAPAFGPDVRAFVAGDIPTPNARQFVAHHNRALPVYYLSTYSSVDRDVLDAHLAHQSLPVAVRQLLVQSLGSPLRYSISGMLCSSDTNPGSVRAHTHPVASQVVSSPSHRKVSAPSRRDP